jgi:Methyltransferase domain
VDATTRARIKRYLGPLLPVLRSIRRRTAAFVERVDPRPSWMAWRARRMDRAAGRAGTPRAPIRSLRKYEFAALVRRAPYYRPRWGYISAAGRIADGLIEQHGLRTALELGPHLRPTIVGADAMDRKTQPDLRAEGRVVIHDATQVPWPFDDKEYDLFVALQVFEHLGVDQPTAFHEVRRVARHAVISLPIDWVMDDPRNCHHGITHEKALSWFAPVVPTRVEIGNPGHKKRLIYVFENLQA